MILYAVTKSRFERTENECQSGTASSFGCSQGQAVYQRQPAVPLIIVGIVGTLGVGIMAAKKNRHKSKRKNKSKLKRKRSILITWYTVRKIMQATDPKDVLLSLGLLVVYKFTGIKQNTNQPYCTDSFIAGEKDESFEGKRRSEGVVSRIRNGLEKIDVITRLKKQDGKAYIGIEKETKLETMLEGEFQEIIHIIGYQIRAQDKEIRLLKVKLEESERENKILRKQLCQLFSNSGFPRVADSKTKSPNSVFPQLRKNESKCLKSINKEMLKENKSIVKKIDDDVCVVKNFFNEDIEINKKLKFYYVCSVKLHRAAKNIKRITKRANIKSWVGQFKKLNTLDKVKKKLIKEILVWYIDHISQEYIPEAFSAKSFREKFEQIVAAKERKRPKRKRPKPYRPNDENDDYGISTKEWRNKKGQIVGTDTFEDEDY